MQWTSPLSDGGVRSVDVLASATITPVPADNVSQRASWTGNVSLPLTAAPLSTALWLVAECSWAGTGELVRLPPLPFTTGGLVVQWAGDVVAGEVVVLPSVARVYPITIAPVPLLDVAPLNLSTTLQCTMQVLNRTSRSLQLSVDALVVEGAVTGSPVGSGITGVVDGPPNSAMAVVAVCTLWGKSATSPPLLLRTTRATTTLLSPSNQPRFVPSDASSPWLLPSWRAAVVAESGALVAGATCTVTVLSQFAQLVPAKGQDPTPFSEGVDADGATSVVEFPQFGLQAPFDSPPVSVQVRCSIAGSGAATPLVVTAVVEPFTVVAAAAPVNRTRSQQPLPLFSIAVRPVHAAVRPPERIVCSLALNGTSNASSAAVTNGVALTDAAGFANFTAATVAAPMGASYALVVTCSAGSLQVGALAFPMAVDGCEVGYQAVDVVCVKCVDGQFSTGGIAPCMPCPPRGATCTGGTISLLANYFRPPSQAALPLTSDSQLYTCFNSEACTLQASTGTYGCAAGYTGALCGVCDADGGFARFGEACRPCWPTNASAALLSVLLVAIFAALTFVAVRRSDGAKSEASIALKILLGYIQVSWGEVGWSGLGSAPHPRICACAWARMCRRWARCVRSRRAARGRTGSWWAGATRCQPPRWASGPCSACGGRRSWRST